MHSDNPQMTDDQIRARWKELGAERTIAAATQAFDANDFLLMVDDMGQLERELNEAKARESVLMAFINREMKMTATDKRIERLAKDLEQAGQ